jgi:hypothetical protein
MKIENIKITEFAKRHFDPKFGGTKILDFTLEEFDDKVNQQLFNYYRILEGANIIKELKSDIVRVLPGYADFCKLLVLKNFTQAKVGSMPIAIENYQYLRSGYSSRAKEELPVLSRWFSLPIPAPVAEYLVIVLYSKEQLNKEKKEEEKEFDGDWGTVAILAQSSSNEEPMTPITMMRNALGIDEGGSGVPIDKEAYQKSVVFWSDNAIIK